MLVKRLLVFLAQQLVSTWALKCLTGHPTAPNVCQSLSYCMTVRSNRGTVQKSCDGNGQNQVSLCSLNTQLRRSQAVPSDFATYSGRSSSSSSSSLSSSSSSRYSPAASQQMCYNAGDFGEICCCQWDYCNGNGRNNFLIALSILFFILIYSNL
ncbi:unnamed protein product, partial [Mesorhabditis belari]|uniref:Uncharacterized protein n=1 Tax=Mesorhabditis belari TaxID=2138241 RepID=A0AAF3EIE8_9BILA